MSNRLSINIIICIFKRNSVTKQFVIVDFYTNYKNAEAILIIPKHIFQAKKV